jgi:hypothetical protein
MKMKIKIKWHGTQISTFVSNAGQEVVADIEGRWQIKDHTHIPGAFPLT